MAQYRKKPVVIEAEQWIAITKKEFPVPPAPSSFLRQGRKNGEWYIHELEGWQPLKINNWIIRGVKGEYYQCEPDIFELTYELVKD